MEGLGSEGQLQLPNGITCEPLKKARGPTMVILLQSVWCGPLGIYFQVGIVLIFYFLMKEYSKYIEVHSEYIAHIHGPTT